MSFLGENLAEEWLNRKGFFTIRGAKVGNGEIDFLAIKYSKDGIERWHYEVQASLRPVSYICPAPKRLRKQGKSAHNAKKRDIKEIKESVAEWIEKKYKKNKIVETRKQLWPGAWKFGLIIGNIKHQDELDEIKKHKIKIIKIAEIIKTMSPKWSSKTEEFKIGAATGADLIDLVYAHKQLKLDKKL